MFSPSVCCLCAVSWEIPGFYTHDSCSNGCQGKHNGYKVIGHSYFVIGLLTVFSPETASCINNFRS